MGEGEGGGGGENERIPFICKDDNNKSGVVQCDEHVSSCDDLHSLLPLGGRSGGAVIRHSGWDRASSIEHRASGACVQMHDPNYISGR